jgi:flagellar basal body-associated protein FliL
VNLWIKIENLLNKILGFLFGGLEKVVRSLTPDQIPLLHKKIKLWLSNFVTKLMIFLGSGWQNILQTIKKNIQNALGYIKKINFKNVVFSVKGEVDTLKGKSPIEIATKPFQIFFKKISSMEPKKALGILAFITFTGLSIFGIVFSSSRIYERTRVPSNIVEEVLPGRPSYYKIDQKQINLTAVKVPIYAQGKHDIKFLTADFDLQMSNRNSVVYIKEHETMIRDHLTNNVEPMDPWFSMEKEGKRVIKDKVKQEINIFLEEQNVEGRVDDINIMYLLGT